MPRSNMLVLECNFCGNKDTFDQNVPQSMTPEKIHKWRQVSCADDPAIQDVDNSRWYDAIDCMTSGEKRHDKSTEEARKMATIAAKVNRPKPTLVPCPESALPPIAEIVKQDS